VDGWGNPLLAPHFVMHWAANLLSALFFHPLSEFLIKFNEYPQAHMAAFSQFSLLNAAIPAFLENRT